MKIKGLTERIKRTVNRIPVLEKDISQKDQQIADYFLKVKQLELKITNKEREITIKDDRILQLNEILKGSADIFAKHNGIITALRAELQKEKSATGISVEYNRHLEKDIKRLDNEKKELDERIKELEAQEGESSQLRDEELKTLSKERDDLSKWKMEVGEATLGIAKFSLIAEETSAEKYLEEMKKSFDDEWREKITILTQERDSRPTQEEFKKLEQELEIERGWWDKWMSSYSLKEYSTNENHTKYFGKVEEQWNFEVKLTVFISTSQSGNIISIIEEIGMKISLSPAFKEKDQHKFFISAIKKYIYEYYKSELQKERERELNKYKLEDFLNWLEIQVQKRDNWSKIKTTNSIIVKEDSSFVVNISYIEKDNNWERIMSGKERGGIYPRGLEILAEWKQEVDQKDS